MLTAARRVHHTYQEYRLFEDAASEKHEYLDGEIYAMAGGTPAHAALASAVARLLGNQLPPSCRTYSSDLRIRVTRTNMSTYPDVSVVCGPVHVAEDDANAVINPVLIVEVTSPSTEAYDRGEKLAHYQQIESLREVLFVGHDAPKLTLVTRSGEGNWEVMEAGAGESIALSSVGAHVSVDELFAVLR